MRIETDDARELQELDDADLSLPILDRRDEGLVASELARHVGLLEAGLPPVLRDELRQALMSG